MEAQRLADNGQFVSPLWYLSTAGDNWRKQCDIGVIWAPLVVPQLCCYRGIVTIEFL